MFIRFRPIALCTLLLGTFVYAQRFPTNSIDSAQAAKIAATLRVGMPENEVAKLLDGKHGLKSGGDVGDSIGWTRFYLLSDGCFLDLKMSPEEVANDGHWGGNGRLASASIQSNGVKTLSIRFTSFSGSNSVTIGQRIAQLGLSHSNDLAIWRSPISSVQERAAAASRLLVKGTSLIEAEGILGEATRHERWHGPLLGSTNASTFDRWLDLYDFDGGDYVSISFNIQPSPTRWEDWRLEFIESGNTNRQAFRVKPIDKR
jgi:hypothetical protein